MEALELLLLLIKFVYDRKSRLRLLGYRPEIICLVMNTGGDKVLMVRPQAYQDVWVPPQEGIKANETVEGAITRCLDVELGLKENQIQFRRSIWIGKRKFQPERWDERELVYSLRGIFGGPSMIGKAYFAALIIADGSANINPNAAETSAWEWVDLAEYRERIADAPVDKRAILWRAWERLVEENS